MSLLFVPGLLAQDLYWTERVSVDGVMVPVIKGADIDGQNVTDVFIGTEMESFIVDLAVTDTHLYWTGHSGGDVWRANLDGSGAQRIIDESAGLTSPHGLVVDQAVGKIYLADHGSHATDDPGGIYSANLSGTGLQNLWTNSPWFYTGISLRGSGALLWIARSSEYLYMQSASGGQPSTVELAASGEIYGLTYHEATNTAYYTHIGGTLHSVNLTTQEQDVLWTPDMTSPLGLKLSPSGTHLLIAERGRGISAYQLSTGGYELLVDAPDAHFAVVTTTDPGDLELPPEPPPPAEPGTILFSADFEEDELEALPAQGWTSTSAPAEGTALVVQDIENAFGAGEENRFLRTTSARHLNLQVNFEPTDLLTLSYDYIGRINEADTGRAMNLNLRASDSSNNDRVHVIQMNPITGLIDTVPFGQNEILYRFDLVVNNSTDTVEYVRPDTGDTASLEPGLASLYRYEYARETWSRLRDSYENVRHASVNLGDRMMNFWIQLDSNDPLRSFDMDNIHIYAGAVPGHNLRDADVSLPPIPYPEEPVLVAFDDFEQYGEPLEITELDDYKGPFTLSRINNQDQSPGGSLHIVRDTENWFGRGSDNMVLYLNDTVQTWLDLPVGELETGVATVAFDMYHDGRHAAGETNRLGARFHTTAITNSNIVHNFGFQAAGSSNPYEGPYFVRGLDSRTIDPGYVQRWAVVTNNTHGPITYETPRGQLELSPSRSHVWLNGHLFNEEYAYGGVQTEQLIRSFRFDSFNHWTAYIDDLRVWEGAIVPGTNIQRESEPAERELLVYEGFDYSEGSVDGLNGGIGWAGGYITSDGSPSAEVVSPGLEWTDLPVTGNSLRASGPTPESDNTEGTRNFRVIDIAGIHSSMLNELSGYTHIGPQGGSVWLSLVGQGNPNQTNTFWGLGLYRNTSEQSGEVLFLGKGSTDTEEDGWRFAGGGGSSISGSMRTGHALSEKHFWAIRIDYNDNGNQVAHLFHNPDPAGPEPTEPTISRETRVGSFGFDRIRIAGNGAGFMLDEIRIGTSWQAVAPLGDDTPPSEGFADWIETHFPGETDPAIIGPNADPDGDGVPNLIEYALGMDPNEPSRDGLPVLEVQPLMVEGVEGNYLTLTGTLPDGTNLDLAVEATSDLTDWSDPDLGVPVGATPNDDGTTTYTFRDVEPIDTSGRRFMRLNVDFRTD